MQCSPANAARSCWIGRRDENRLRDAFSPSQVPAWERPPEKLQLPLRLAKQELGRVRSQAGAWERGQIAERGIHRRSNPCRADPNALKAMSTTSWDILVRNWNKVKAEGDKMESKEEGEGHATSIIGSRLSLLAARRDFVLRLFGVGGVFAIIFKSWQGLWAIVFGPRWRITADPESEWGGRVREVEYRNFYVVPREYPHCGLIRRYWAVRDISSQTLEIWAKHALYEARENFADAFSAGTLFYNDEMISSFVPRYVILLLKWNGTRVAVQNRLADGTSPQVFPDVAFLINPQQLFDRTVDLANVIDDGFRVKNCFSIKHSEPDQAGQIHVSNGYRILDHILPLDPSSIF